MGDSWNNQGERTMKKGNRYFSPLTFNLLAVVWIIGFLPLDVAIVSNVGSDPNNDDYQQMTVPPENCFTMKENHFPIQNFAEMQIPTSIELNAPDNIFHG